MGSHFSGVVEEREVGRKEAGTLRSPGWKLEEAAVAR